MLRRIPLLLVLLLNIVAFGASEDALYRINAGGGAYTDENGNQWEAGALNKYYNEGNSHSTTNAIWGTNDDPLYQTELWKEMVWTFPISVPGDYQVRLHFAEVYVTAPNSRVFDVKIQGDLVMDDFDIYATVGPNTAYSQSFPVTVTGDSLTIEFIKNKQNPKVCAIEILPAYSLYINSGGPQVQDSRGITWLADTSFFGGKAFAQPGAAIADTEDDKLFRTERYGELYYEIQDVPNGDVEVGLSFAEIYFTAPSSAGKRVFDVWIQGQPVLEDFDIFATVGPNTADVETFTATVTDGTLTIELKKVKENPKINAIAVRSMGSSPEPTLPTQTDPVTSTTLPAATDPAPTDPAPSEPSVGAALYRVNAGGGQYTDSEGNIWEADSYFDSGKPFALPGTAIALTQDDELFESERWDPPSGNPLKYEFNVDNGSYEIHLGFAEVYGLVTGQRVFNVIIEGETVLANHDIYAAVGANAADVEIVATDVTDGKLTILFEHVVENPKICSIAIFPMTSSGTTTTTTTASAPVGGDGPALYRINVGGSAFTDDDGKDWDADSFFTGGLTYTNGNAGIDTSAPGTSDVSLYRTERYRDDMSYSFPVTNGPYKVTLHYAEIYQGTKEPGQRVFDVNIEGTTVVDNFDIASSVGPFKATTQVATVNVQDGSLEITFGKVVQNPKLNGIEVISLSGPTTPSPPTDSVALYRVNAGGGQFTDSQGLTWLADDDFVQNGSPYGPVNTAIGLTEDDILYQTERYDPPAGQPMKFEFNVPSGFYEIRLHFCEVYGLTTGQRVFNVLAEGKYVLTNHDIYAAVGANKADIETVVTEVTDGKLTISFEHSVENPKINAIEVYETSATAPTVPTAPAQTTSPTEPSSFEPIYINVGGGAIYDPSTGITWEADNYYNTGTTGYKESQSISGTDFQELYKSERWDADEYPNMIYSIPLPDGVFEVTLYFADTYKRTHSVGARIFDVYVEGSLEIEDLDIFATVGKNAAWVETITTTCNDGTLEIEFKHKVENPTLSGIEVKSVGVVKPHYAHAVPGGPYYATDTTGEGVATVAVDGFFSHTHAAGAQLASFEWKVDDVVVADTEQAEFSLDVGEHIVSLTVVDTTGDISEDSTTATVRPFGYPFIASLSPDSGEMFGGEVVTISGASFTPDSIVKFGSAVLSGPSEINVVDANTIEVLAVPPASWGMVSVTVVTPVDESNPVDYEYLPLIPLNFKKGNVMTGIFGPTTLAFGPDGNLYVGTQGGDIIKLALDENYNVDEELSDTTTAIPDSEPTSPFRSILGLAFDPMDTCEPPNGCKIYVAHSFLFHGDIVNYNGKVSAVSGANLDIVEDVVINLPVSDHDHGINGLEFDDNGNMYIQVGGNTNAGVEGALSQTYLQKENYLSAATLIARGVTSPTFDGLVEYNANGDMTAGFDVEVYSAGMRNPFDLVFHSNGKLYGTDNGPNLKFGYQSTSCTDAGPEPTHKDKLVLIEEGTYHGHANRKRGETDPRQCIWRDIDETSEGYTGPIKKLESSTNGICEFQSDHFGGALRGQLILGRYKGELFHVKLTNEGEGAGVMEEFPNILTEDGGLDVSQGPDGTLFVAQNFQGTVLYQAPDEEEAELLTVKSVFPRRGPEAGGTLLTIYGQKLFEIGVDPVVSVGSQDCAIHSTNTYTDVNGRTAQWVKCKLPSGTGTADVVVSFGEESYTFAAGYRYITGEPVPPSGRLLRKKARQ